MTDIGIRGSRYIHGESGRGRRDPARSGCPTSTSTFLKAVVRDLNSENLWGVDGGLDPTIQEFTAELNMKLGNLPVAAPAKDVLDPRFVDAAHARSSALTRRNERQWQARSDRLPAAADGMVVYEDVSKFFPVRVRPGQKDRPELMVALDRVNATVRKGELVTLLGPSGCGKTTLLRLTAGLITADEGRITIEGTPVTGPRKDACTVFQNFGLLPWRTVHRQCRVSARDRRRAAQPSAASSPIISSISSGSAPLPSIIRTSFRAACSSASASRAR